MPATSQSQRRFFGMVRAVQRGDLSIKGVSKGVADAAKRVTPSDAHEFAVTKEKNLPERVEDEDEKKITKKSDIIKEAGYVASHFRIIKL